MNIVFLQTIEAPYNKHRHINTHLWELNDSAYSQQRFAETFGGYYKIRTRLMDSEDAQGTVIRWEPRDGYYAKHPPLYSVGARPGGFSGFTDNSAPDRAFVKVFFKFQHESQPHIATEIVRTYEGKHIPHELFNRPAPEPRREVHCGHRECHAGERRGDRSVYAPPLRPA